MTDTVFTTFHPIDGTFRPTDRTGIRYRVGAFVETYWWAQSVARTYARTNDVARSVSETNRIV